MRMFLLCLHTKKKHLGGGGGGGEILEKIMGKREYKKKKR